MPAMSTTPSRLQYLSQQNNPNPSADPFTGMSVGYNWPLGQAAYQAPQGANPDFSMAYSDYLGSYLGQHGPGSQNPGDPLPWEDWYKQQTSPIQPGVPVVNNVPVAPPPPPPPAPPPPPPAPAVPRPSMVSWSDVAPSLINLDQLGALFAPDQNVMSGFQGQRDSTNQQVTAGRNEIDRQRGFGESQVDTLPAQYDRIFGGVDQLLQNAGQTTDAAVAQRTAGQSQGNSAENLAPLQIANQMTKGGYEAQVPLLKAGFGEQAAKQNGFLTQLGTQLQGDIDARQNDYTAGVSSARQSALGQAMGQNAQTQNQAGQFNAEHHSQVDQYNSQAQQAWEQGNADLAYKYATLAQQAALSGPTALDLALKGVGPGMTLQDIAAQNTPGGANLNFDINKIASKIPTGDKEVSLPAALKLQQSGYGIDQLAPNALKAYNDVRDKVLQGGDIATVLGDAQKKYGTKYPRALNLALLDSGGFKDQLGGLYFGG